MENNIQNKRGSNFVHRIRYDNERTYSNLDFQFHSVPINLIAASGENTNAFLKEPFFKVLENVDFNNLHLYIPEFSSSVKIWRKGVLDEMDNLGIRYNSGEVDYSYYFSTERKKNVNTKILSENFKKFPRILNYDWLKNNDRKIEIAIDLFVKELKKATRLNRKRAEKKFHKLFNKFPFFLKRDNYSNYWHEPRFYYNDKEYYEPDFGLKPNFNQKTDLSILEIKLPNEGFIKKTKFHRKPYSTIIDHIFQVNDYKEYLESDEYLSNIKKVFGFVPESIDYNILIGRLDDKMADLSVFNKRLRQINSTHINFVSYDELLEYQVKYLERIKMLKIL